MPKALSSNTARARTYLLGAFAVLWVVLQVANVAHAADLKAHSADPTCHFCQHHERLGASPTPASPVAATFLFADILPFATPDFVRGANESVTPPCRAPPAAIC